MPMICLVLMQIKATQLIRYKQLFQNKHSTDHAVVQLAGPITEYLEITNIHLVYSLTCGRLLTLWANPFFSKNLNYMV